MIRWPLFLINTLLNANRYIEGLNLDAMYPSPLFRGLCLSFPKFSECSKYFTKTVPLPPDIL